MKFGNKMTHLPLAVALLSQVRIPSVCVIALPPCFTARLLTWLFDSALDLLVCCIFLLVCLFDDLYVLACAPFVLINFFFIYFFAEVQGEKRKSVVLTAV